MTIASFSKETWARAEKMKGVMIRITIRHADGYAMEVEGVFATASAQHDLASCTQRLLLNNPRTKTAAQLLKRKKHD